MKKTTEKRARQLVHAGLRLMRRPPRGGQHRVHVLIHAMGCIMFEEGCNALDRMPRARIYNGTDRP
jgi:hypothetical protein